jgi:glycosyltransferase involved in cell wall biosynthesis
MFWMLAQELSRRGHQIVVVTSDSLSRDERAAKLDEVLAPNIRVHRFRNRFNAMSAGLPAVFYRPRSMRRGLRDAMSDADVVHMGESRGIHNLWAARATAQAHVPLVWSAFGGLPTATGVRGAYRRMHDTFLTRHVVPRVDAFVAESEHEELVYREHGAPEARIHMIPLCVDLSLFERLPERGALRRTLGLGAGDQLVVSVARLAPPKGLDLLVDAFARLPRTGGGPHLALVGWDHGSLPNLKAQVKRLALETRVHFPGALYGEERLIAYRDADVFCLTPTVYEETSLAALEAAASACATVLSAQCEVPGLAAAGGGVVARRDAASVAGALSDLLADGARRLEMGERARDYVSSHFSASAVAALYEALFQELIADSRLGLPSR